MATPPPPPPTPTPQIPRESNRAQPWRPAAALLYTGQDRPTADRLAANLLPKPAATTQNLLGVQQYLAQWNQSFGANATSVPGEVLSLMGLTLGTSARISVGLYVETALMRAEVGRGGGVMGCGVVGRWGMAKEGVRGCGLR